MIKCLECKHCYTDTDNTCYKKRVTNIFTGMWTYDFRSIKNVDGKCKDFQKIRQFFGLKLW